VRYPQLDERLQTAADFFPSCDIGADIGADHGRLSCYLLANNICQRMIVSDISKSSLEKAKNLLTLHKLSDRACFRVADGLDAICIPIAAIAICGMGGHTISKILKNGISKLSGSNVIVSAHSDIPALRETIANAGLQIVAERIAKAGTRFYVIIHARQGHSEYTEHELFIGPCLITGEARYAREYFLHMRRTEYRVRNQLAKTHLLWIDEVLSRLQST
jgi:tRNA (adenine22-N1)-methyltransferase